MTRRSPFQAGLLLAALRGPGQLRPAATRPVGRRAAILMGISGFTAGVAGMLRARPMPAESGRFEVASIRASAANGRPAMKLIPGGGLRATNVTLKLLI